MTTRQAVDILNQVIQNMDDWEFSEVASMALQTLQEKAERIDGMEY